MRLQAGLNLLRRLSYRLNPVLRRELLERMRSRSAAVVLTVYLALLSLVIYLTYQGNRGSVNAGSGFDGPLPTEVATVGRSIFEWLVIFMVLLVLFLVPGLTAGAISGERERQTLVPLQVTQLRSWSILAGKLGASLAFLLLMMVATLPLLAVTYLIGGVTTAEVLGALGLVVLVGVVVGAISVSVSAFARRVQLATVVSYGIVLVLTVGTLLVTVAMNEYQSRRGGPQEEIIVEGDGAVVVERGFEVGPGLDTRRAPRSGPRLQRWILLPNPLVTVASGLAGTESSSVRRSGTPVSFIESQLRGDITCAPPEPDGNVTCWNDWGQEFSPPRTDDLWWKSGALLVGLALLAFGVGTLRLRAPARQER